MSKRILTLIFSLFVTLISFKAKAIQDCGSVDGLSIPCWTTYIIFSNASEDSLPYYPYARRPNGCSLIIKKPGTADVFKIKNDIYSFKDACNAHDRCYYTLNSEAKTCNKILLDKMNNACADSGSDETRYWCYTRAIAFYNTAELAAPIAHTYSQTIQRHYANRVEKYLSKNK